MIIVAGLAPDWAAGRTFGFAMAVASAIAILTSGALAGGVSPGVLRAQTEAVDRAIGTQLQAPAGRFGGAPGAFGAESLLGGSQMIRAPEGTALRAGPGPGGLILDHLDPGVPVLVTRPDAGGGWAEVLSGGRLGYVWAPHLTPSAVLQPPPWGQSR